MKSNEYYFDINLSSKQYSFIHIYILILTLYVFHVKFKYMDKYHRQVVDIFHRFEQFSSTENIFMKSVRILIQITVCNIVIDDLHK